VRDPAVHNQVLNKVVEAAAKLDLGLLGLMPSPVRGPAGNVEFLGWWRLGVDDPQAGSEVDAAVAACMAEVGGGI